MTAAALPRTRWRRPRLLRGPLILVAPALFGMVVFVAIPFAETVRLSLIPASNHGITFARYTSFFTDSVNLGILKTTFITSILVAVITLVIVYPVALYIAFSRDPARRYVLLAVLSPLLISVVVRSFALIILIGPNNPMDQLTGDTYASLLNTRTAVLIGLVYVFMSFMLLSVLGVLTAIDPRVISAARTLGAGNLAVLWRVIIPLTLPGIESGCLIVFMLSATSFALPLLLGGSGYKMIASLIYQQIFGLFDWPAAYALGVILLALSAAVLYLVMRLARGRNVAPTTL